MPTIDEEAAHVVGTKKRVDPLGLWVIYDHPKDFPDKFVARCFYIGPRVILASEDFVTSDTLNGVRALLPDGLHNLGRHEHDEPQIVETWV